MAQMSFNCFLIHHIRSIAVVCSQNLSVIIKRQNVLMDTFNLKYYLDRIFITRRIRLFAIVLKSSRNFLM